MNGFVKNGLVLLTLSSIIGCSENPKLKTQKEDKNIENIVQEESNSKKEDKSNDSNSNLDEPNHISYMPGVEKFLFSGEGPTIMDDINKKCYLSDLIDELRIEWDLKKYQEYKEGIKDYSEMEINFLDNARVISTSKIIEARTNKGKELILELNKEWDENDYVLLNHIKETSPEQERILLEKESLNLNKLYENKIKLIDFSKHKPECNPYKNYY